MTMLRATGIRLSFGSRTLFDQLELVVEEGERVGLIGVNGSGKSTLLQILAAVQPPDAGELQLRRGARVTYLPQEPTFPPGATVSGELSVANAPLRAAIDAHQQLSARIAHAPAEEHDKLLGQLGKLAQEVEARGGWDTEHRARALLDRLGVKDWDGQLETMSGGQRKRVAIARALLSAPDLLLLDEPTNHLDADTVDWLEDELDRMSCAIVLVTHDRYFLDDLVDRIVEIRPGEQLASYPGNYEAYLAQKLVEDEEAQARQHKRERWIAQEVAWLRRGVEARRTKSKARIQRAQALMQEKGLVQRVPPALQLITAPRLSGTVLEAHKVSKSYGDKPVLRDVELIVQRGERLGIVGKNGAGKTTLVRVLLGETPADSGKVVVGKGTRVAYFDQMRATLDPEQTVFEAASGEDYIDLGGKRIALRDYLDDLLFPVPMQRLKVAALSGGERNRLLLARLFLQGANVLVLDEPTNDLDLVTLNVLEKLLLEFTGSVLLVTHDRYFLDKVASAIVSFEEDGKVIRTEGNYEMYRTLREQREQQQRSASSEAARSQRAAAAQASSAAQAQQGKGSASAPPTRKAGKLSFKEQRELDGMEQAIEAAETRKAAAEAELMNPANHRGPAAAALPTLQADLDAATAEVERLYARWQVLQDLAAGQG